VDAKHGELALCLPWRTLVVLAALNQTENLKLAGQFMGVSNLLAHPKLIEG
jgi:hypothetical protein